MKSEDITLADNIYHNIRNEIAYLQLEPGYKLSEVKLAKQYNCSRIPVREAVQRLANEGCLEIFPKRGSFVSPIDLVKLERMRYIREVIETRIILDDFDKGLLKPIIPILSAMVSRQKQMLQVNDYNHIFELDNEFHFLFFSVDKKDFAFDYSGMNEINYFRARLLTLKAEAKTNMVSQHTAIIDAIDREDREDLNAVLVQHFRNVTNVMQCTTFQTKDGLPYFRGEARAAGPASTKPQDTFPTRSE